MIGPSIDKAVKRAFNISAEDFDIKFRRFLRWRYLKILTERGEPTDFGERFKLEDTPSAELSPRVFPSGDFVAAISTYKGKADVVVASTRERKLYKNLTKGNTTKYEYLIAQWIETGPQGGPDIAISPDGNDIAVFARRERGRDLLLLNALGGGIHQTILMPDLDQQYNPTFSPDGEYIAFRAMKGGQADIWTYNRGTGAFANLTNDDAFDSAPTYSPDGKWVYYFSVKGNRSKIFRIDPKDPATREQVTYGDWNDEDPVLSPDGKRLFYTSDRDGGIYNIYSVDLETGETLLHTNVVAGAFCPAVAIGRDNAEKLIFMAYYKRQFTVYVADSKKFVRRLAELNPAITPVAPFTQPKYQPAIEVSVDPEKVNPKPGHKLYLEDAQIIAGINTDQTFVTNTVLTFGDNLGDRRFIASLYSVSTYTDFRFTYADIGQRLQKAITVYDSRSYFYTQDPSTGLVSRAQQAERYTGGTLLASYPLSRYYRLDGGLGFVSRAINYPFAITNNTGQQVVIVQPRTDNFPQISATLTGDTTIYQAWGPWSGNRFALSVNYAPDLKGSSDQAVEPPATATLTTGLSLDYRQYIPITKRMLFAIRLYGAASRGNFPDVYSFGGLDTLQGLDYNAIIGNTVGYGDFELRFPLIDYLILPIGGLRDIRASAFVDIGGGALLNQKFQFWTTSGNAPALSGCRGKSGPCLVDGIASFGFGLDVNFLGLPLHWNFARLWNFQKTLTSFRTSFYIGPSF